MQGINCVKNEIHNTLAQLRLTSAKTRGDEAHLVKLSFKRLFETLSSPAHDSLLHLDTRTWFAPFLHIVTSNFTPELTLTGIASFRACLLACLLACVFSAIFCPDSESRPFRFTPQPSNPSTSFCFMDTLIEMRLMLSRRWQFSRRQSLLGVRFVHHCVLVHQYSPVSLNRIDVGFSLGVRFPNPQPMRTRPMKSYT